ncbi:hypothetical protein [Pseudonocardia sp. GCM10023141]|uniref:hypothetical protein n=1 Tax=Pseudonocardia sp. GCM10023141 TaxID=3252653 RepID=UPI00360EC2BC
MTAVARLRQRFRERYGASPLHLLATLASLALAGYAVTRFLADTVPLLGVAIWFVGAAIGHDVVLYPLYAIADTATHGRLLRRRHPLPHRLGVPWINHVRVPIGLSALLLLIWFPLILGGRGADFEGATGLSTDGYAGHWLGITGALLLGSAILYALRLRRVGSAARRADAAQAPASRLADQ